MQHPSGGYRRNGDYYALTETEINDYNELGYLVVKEVLTEAELQLLDPWFDHFIAGKEMDRMKRDFCDMSQPYGTPIEDFQLVNAINPSYYRPELVNNIFQRVAQSMASQLYKSGKAEMDYEQFLAKKPSKAGAEFAMHQDLGYWPKTANTWTATFSLALTDSQIINGCLQVMPGTNKEPALRKHVPKGHSQGDASVSRDESHTLVIETIELAYQYFQRQTDSSSGLKLSTSLGLSAGISAGVSVNASLSGGIDVSAGISGGLSF
jgi:Rod binding domain-containing protein